MCGVSGVELLVVIVAAVILLGPDRLPELMRWLGRTMREVRKLTGDLSKVRDEVRSTLSMDDLRAQVREELQIERAREARRDAEAEIDAIRKRLKSAVDAESAAVTSAIDGHADAAQDAVAASGASAASADAVESSGSGSPTSLDDPLAMAGVTIRSASGSVAHQDGLDVAPQDAVGSRVATGDPSTETSGAQDAAFEEGDGNDGGLA